MRFPVGVGDVIQIRRPVTPAWVKFMGMDDLARDGRPQTWIRTGTSIDIERRIAAISGDTIGLDVPLSDSLDAKYLSPPGTAVAKVAPPVRLAHVGVEHLHIRSPPQNVLKATLSVLNRTALRLHGHRPILKKCLTKLQAHASLRRPGKPIHRTINQPRGQ
jgi:hypothetical protein